jgi:hypothetical protein
LAPKKEFVEEVVRSYKNAPAAYGVDIGVTSEYDCVIESNDGCNLGNYGLDSIHYGEMIVSRWTEIVNEKRSTSRSKFESVSAYAQSIRNNKFDLNTFIKKA